MIMSNMSIIQNQSYTPNLPILMFSLLVGWSTLSCEGCKKNYSTNQEQVEELRKELLNLKAETEKNKQAAETAKQEAVTAQQTAETAKQTAETAKQTAETAKQATETAKQATETAKQATETAKQTAETAKQEAEEKGGISQGLTGKLEGAYDQTKEAVKGGMEKVGKFIRGLFNGTSK
jgi:methyl-accepting chemotaxis protein